MHCSVTGHDNGEADAFVFGGYQHRLAKRILRAKKLAFCNS